MEKHNLQSTDPPSEALAKITFDKWGNVLNNGTITLNDDYTISIDKLTGFTEVIN